VRTILLSLSLSTIALYADSSKATIVDSGSTNRPGMRITVEAKSEQATIEPRGGEKQNVKVPKQMREKLMSDLAAAGPLNELPVRHCMKSVSFGSTLHIELDGTQSGDLSCPRQTDPRVIALKNDAEEILRMARGR
jgi:hypothetical protein